MSMVDHLTDPDTGEIAPSRWSPTTAAPSGRSGSSTSSPHIRSSSMFALASGRRVRVRERAFQSLKYERLYREQIDDALDLVREADAYRTEFNTIRPHEALSWTRPSQVHRGLAAPGIPNFPEHEILPTT
ncbi:integrase core domain-containing protein [Dermacoccus sp. 147Ba]|uniref:integrase core domain-containing protein n=1 Tax=Dermacoccus sp. 147Ba TaxID=2510111 RepID=UPI001F109A4C|nr:integrase core domain-containing protein [Dermacoccus sp. 147Ba]